MAYIPPRTYESSHTAQSSPKRVETAIAEWAEFIAKDPARNASGTFAFLQSPPQRLVIIGKGLHDRDRLLETRFTETTVWTYDLLIEQAGQRNSDQINMAREAVGLPRIPLFGARQ